MSEVENDVGKEFNVEPERLLQRTRPGHFWLGRRAMKELNVTAGELAEFFTDYRFKDNVSPHREVPETHHARLHERAFSAAFPSDRVDEVWDCVAPG